jgi:hypothetical protein
MILHREDAVGGVSKWGLAMLKHAEHGVCAGSRKWVQMVPLRELGRIVRVCLFPPRAGFDVAGALSGQGATGRACAGRSRVWEGLCSGRPACST